MEDESSFKNFKFGEWHCEKNRERMEYRRCAVFDLDAECNNEDTILGVLGATSSLGKMDGCFKTVAMYEGVRIPLEQDEEGNDITPSLKEFLKNGSRKKPNPKTGDDETCDIYKIGIVSSRVLSPDEVIAIKRLHWSVENKLHHVLDVSLYEDMSSAKIGKWNLSLVRKIVINLIRYCRILNYVEHMDSIPCASIELFGNAELLRKVIFEKLSMIRMDK